MIYVALICAALIGLVVYERRQNAVREKEWSLERGALLTRIQHPTVVQQPILDEEALEERFAREQARAEEETDDFDLVGTIQHGDGDSDSD